MAIKEAVLLFILPFTLAHTFLQCTHWDPSLIGDAACNQTDNWPYYEPFSSIGKEFIYTHREAGQPLCSYGSPGTQSLPLSPSVPTVKAGQTVRIVWSNNGGSYISNFENSTENGVDITNRFAYVWHAPSNDPSDELFHSKPYAQFDWMNSKSRNFQYGRDFDMPWSADKDHFGIGNLTISEELESGLHTFIFAWRWLGTELVDPLFDHVSCFQYNVENAKKDATIKVSHAMPSETWTPVYTHTVGDTLTPLTGLQQTLDANPATLTRDNGQLYTAFMRSASNFLGADAASQTAVVSLSPEVPTIIAQSLQKVATPTAQPTQRFTFEEAQPVLPARHVSFKIQSSESEIEQRARAKW